MVHILRPLLCEINQMKQCGYTMEHKWKQDVNKDEQSSLEVKITSQAYMDDTTWINHKQQQLKSILMVADDFYTLNNIQVNKTKSVLITNAIKDGFPVTFQFGTDSIVIKPCKPNESTRMLGVWINIKLKHQFVKVQVKDEITKACQLMMTTFSFVKDH